MSINCVGMMQRTVFAAFAVIPAVSGIGLASVDEVIPMPRQITRLEGTLILRDRSLSVAGSPGAKPPYQAAVDLLITDLTGLGVPATGKGDAGDVPCIVDCASEANRKIDARFEQAGALPDPNWGPEGYRLKITPNEILLAGNSAAGCFYGLQTIRQMLDPLPDGKGARLECVDIRDWPAMTWRGTMFAIENPSEHARLAYYKMNLVNWEVNDLPDYKTIPEFAGGIPLSHIREVGESARRHFVSLILETQSFGHVEWMLDKIPALRAMPDNNYVIKPLHEPTYAFLDKMYAELCPLYDTPIFHPGCDEAWGVEQWCEQQKLNTAEVVGKHIQRLADLLKKRGKRAMIWGDYLLEHRDAIKWMNPKDFIICDWHYEPDKEYPSVDFFVKNGFETIVSPSVMPARPVFPDYRKQIPNIRNFIQDGYKRGAIGLLNTNWPVDPIPTECYWYGWVCGAEFAWNPTGRSQEAFDNVFFRKAYGLSTERAWAMLDKLAALEAMAELDRQARSPKAKLMESITYGMGLVVPVGPPVDKSRIEQAGEAVDKAMRESGDDMRHRGLGFRTLLDRFAAIPSLITEMDRLGAALTAGAKAIVEANAEQTGQALKDARTACDAWLKRMQTCPAKQQYAEGITLAKAIQKTLDAAADNADRLGAALDIIGVKPATPGKTARIRPATFVRPDKSPEGIQPPFTRSEGWCHFPSHGASASWVFRVQRPGRYRFLALLRHSAGIWENGRFVRGGRNAAYAGRYDLTLDGQPIKEQWIGEELNPNADEAFRWAVLVDRDLPTGEHTLTVRPRDVNHAIVAEFILTTDDAFVPETKRSDIKLK